MVEEQRHYLSEPIPHERAIALLSLAQLVRERLDDPETDFKVLKAKWGSYVNKTRLVNNDLPWAHPDLIGLTAMLKSPKLQRQLGGKSRRIKVEGLLPDEIWTEEQYKKIATAYLGGMVILAAATQKETSGEVQGETVFVVPTSVRNEIVSMYLEASSSQKNFS